LTLFYFYVIDINLKEKAMKRKIIIFFLLIFLALPVQASDPRPVSFRVTEDGEVFGTLEDGTHFSQTNISASFRIQKFQWEGGFWYVTDKGIIEAKNDREAILLYFIK